MTDTPAVPPLAHDPNSRSRPVRIALLADLVEPVSADATAETAIVAYETARAMQAWTETSDGVAIDLFALHGSARWLPLVSIGLDELGSRADDPLERFAIQDAVYCQLWLDGMLRGYDLVHCLAPVVAPLQLLAGTGTAIVQTLVVPPSHPSYWLPPQLCPPTTFRRLALTRAIGTPADLPLVGVGVDLARFVLADRAALHLLWDGSGGEQGAACAAAVGERLGYPLQTVADGDPPGLLQRAVVLLHLAESASPCGTPWAVRALACGTPVAGWYGALEELAQEPDSGVLAPVGDWETLADRITRLPDRSVAGRRRREVALAKHGQAAMVARYRAVYRELLDGP
jgi:hypothetical protein